MNDLNQWGAYEVPEPMLAKIRSLFGTGWADEDQVREMIADCWNKNHYVIDPHTACGYYVMQQMPRDPLTPRVLLSTASPYKFPRVVNESLGLDSSGTGFRMHGRACRRRPAPLPQPHCADLETANVRFDHVVDIDGMEGLRRAGRQNPVNEARLRTVSSSPPAVRNARAVVFVKAATVACSEAN